VVVIFSEKRSSKFMWLLYLVRNGQVSYCAAFQLCSTGYYRDFSDRSSSVLGACTKCPCNGKEESCSVSYDSRVTCKCLPGYTGRYCDSVGK